MDIQTFDSTNWGGPVELLLDLITVFDMTPSDEVAEDLENDPITVGIAMAIQRDRNSNYIPGAIGWVVMCPTAKVNFAVMILIRDDGGTLCIGEVSDAGEINFPGIVYNVTKPVVDNAIEIISNSNPSPCGFIDYSPKKGFQLHHEKQSFPVPLMNSLFPNPEFSGDPIMTIELTDFDEDQKEVAIGTLTSHEIIKMFFGGTC